MRLCALANRIFTFAVQEKDWKNDQGNQMVLSLEMRSLDAAVTRSRGEQEQERLRLLRRFAIPLELQIR
jgi:hypothetical protein